MNVSMSDLRELLCASATTPAVKTIQDVWRIVVLQRGWVVVGQVSQTGDELTITDASVIRTWGTTKGLGELALNGPLSGTKLDPCGTVRAHIAAVVFQMESDGAKWKK